MSPEDIFAAQMWPWPEPALKRDSMGRVLFVNAAFLQMYGGQIEDWRGNIVTGWPAPQAPGMPYRFETRLPSESGEQIYDWMEFTMADGNAFAMARNITYLYQTPEPDPGIAAQPPEAPQSQPIETQAAMQMPAATSTDTLPAFAEQVTEPSVQNADIPAQEPVLQSAPVESYVSESQETAMDISAEVAADPVFDAASYTDQQENGHMNAAHYRLRTKTRCWEIIGAMRLSPKLSVLNPLKRRRILHLKSRRL